MKVLIKVICAIIVFFLVFMSCTHQNADINTQINGTWLLVSSEIKAGNKVTIEDLSTRKMIKIITATHYSFLSHDLNKGQDSTASFVSGGGPCRFQDNKYIEQLEYCNYREWEGLNVEFDVTFNKDTLILCGIERIDEIDIYQEITEKFIKIKN